MTNIDATELTLSSVMNSDGYLVAALNQNTCAHCDKAFGRKKATVADDDLVVHRHCVEGYHQAKIAELVAAYAEANRRGY